MGEFIGRPVLADHYHVKIQIQLVQFVQKSYIKSIYHHLFKIMASINVHQFSGKVFDKQVCYQVIKMNNSLVIWIAMESDPSFRELSVAMKTGYEKSPTAVKLMGDTSSLTSSTMAARLSKRCGKQVFVSFNVSDTNQEMFGKIEERLVEETVLAPHCF